MPGLIIPFNQLKFFFQLKNVQPWNSFDQKGPSLSGKVYAKIKEINLKHKAVIVSISTEANKDLKNI